MVPIILIGTSKETQSGMQVSNEMNGTQTQRCLLLDSFLMSDRSSTLSGCGFNRECIGSPLKRPRAGWMQSFKLCHWLSLPLPFPLLLRFSQNCLALGIFPLGWFPPAALGTQFFEVSLTGMIGLILYSLWPRDEVLGHIIGVTHNEGNPTQTIGTESEREAGP